MLLLQASLLLATSDRCTRPFSPSETTTPPHAMAMSFTGLYSGQSSNLIRRTICPSCILPSRNKFKLKNGYMEPSYDRKLLLAACEPIIPLDRRPQWDRCHLPEYIAKQKEIDETVHPRAALLAKELRQQMLNAKVIGFYHKNAMKEEDHVSVKNALQHKNLWMKLFNRRIYDYAIRDTKFSNLRSLLCDQRNTVLVIGYESDDLKRLIQMEKKMPGFLLMCAFVEDRILRKDQMVAFSEIGSLDEMRAQFSATLNHALASVSSHIAHPATILSLSLDQYVKREQQDKKQDSSRDQAETAVNQTEGGK